MLANSAFKHKLLMKLLLVFKIINLLFKLVWLSNALRTLPICAYNKNTADVCLQRCTSLHFGDAKWIKHGRLANEARAVLWRKRCFGFSLKAAWINKLFASQSIEMKTEEKPTKKLRIHTACSKCNICVYFLSNKTIESTQRVCIMYNCGAALSDAAVLVLEGLFNISALPLLVPRCAVK